MTNAKSVASKDSKIGVIGDHVRVEGGIHFYTIKDGKVNPSDFKQPPQESESEKPPISENPYVSLSTFKEKDADRFFGREKVTARLWKKFRDLSQPSACKTRVRLLPILGPSGSGKSSVARAGLIPKLARRPLPGQGRAQVAVLLPGSDPVWSLAIMLARLDVDDQRSKVKKADDYAAKLKTRTPANQFNGLAQSVGLLKNDRHDADARLIILVDQFEEVYSLCRDTDDRACFIGNLLYAASDPSGHVSVIITLRSDFLKETQSDTVLNQVIAQNGEIIPAMNPKQLGRAIAKPAQNAGRPLEKAVVDMLIHQTRGHEGALPLLQFALTRIWEGLEQGKDPADTLKQIGGVGGALAGEARRLYKTLTKEEQAIARRAFLAMVNLGEGIKDTRRRISLDQVVASHEKPEHVKAVLERFSGRDARLITLSAETESDRQTAEVTHEALLEHWTDLKTWLDANRDDLRLLRRLEADAREWQKQKRPSGSLWRPPDLDLAQKLYQTKQGIFSKLQADFFKASKWARRKRRLTTVCWVGFIIVVVAAAFIYVQTEKQKAVQKQREAELRLCQNFQKNAGDALDYATAGYNPAKNFRHAWLYTLEALKKAPPLPDANQKLAPSIKRLSQKRLLLGMIYSLCANPSQQTHAFTQGGAIIKPQLAVDLYKIFLKQGQTAFAFQAVYQCSFDLFGLKMQGNALVPLEDNEAGGKPWFGDHPRSLGQDPVRWMLESAARAVAKGKLAFDHVSPEVLARYQPQAVVVEPPRPLNPTLLPDAEFVFIPSGSFFMGSPMDDSQRYSNETFRMVTLTQGFYLQTTEVTQGQWKAVMGANPSNFKDCGDDCPVDNVSWNDIKEFIETLNKKGPDEYWLPTEAEWEYACRAGSVTRYGFGDDAAKLNEYAWYDENSDNRTHKKATRKANAWGLYDMHGNVWEWCRDSYGNYETKEVVNPLNDSKDEDAYRVLRGGSWSFSARGCRSAYRGGIHPGNRNDYYGFRLVLLPGQEKASQ